MLALETTSQLLCRNEPIAMFCCAIISVINVNVARRIPLPHMTLLINLQYLDEVYTTEHWMVRIYKVRKNINRGPPAKKLPSK